MINGSQLRDAIVSAAYTIANQKQKVDELNVFPVPDGDTGTNMSMTIGAATRELELLKEPTVSETAKVAASALLRGARGNSGVILSLLFRGFSKGMKGKVEATGVDFAEALSEGVAAAYKAVMKPTEGHPHRRPGSSGKSPGSGKPDKRRPHRLPGHRRSGGGDPS